MANATESDKTFIAKLGNSFLALIGAITPNDFAAKFESAWTALTEKVETLSGRADFDAAPLLARLDALETFKASAEGKLTAVEAATKPEAVRLLAKEEATILLGKVGASTPVPAAPSTQTASTQGTSALVAEGKFEEAWAADAKLQEQFVTARHYALYMKAATEGRVFAKSN